MTDDDMKKLMLTIAEGLDKISAQLTALEDIQRATIVSVQRYGERAWRESLDRDRR